MRQGVGTTPRTLPHNSKETTTSLSTYLNKVTATSQINIMNSIMAARRTLRPIDNRMTPSAIRSRMVLSMAHHMVRIQAGMMDLDRARNMDMVTGMNMVIRAFEDRMKRRKLNDLAENAESK